jgi:hypothetical protein
MYVRILTRLYTIVLYPVYNAFGHIRNSYSYSLPTPTILEKLLMPSNASAAITVSNHM